MIGWTSDEYKNIIKITFIGSLIISFFVIAVYAQVSDTRLIDSMDDISEWKNYGEQIGTSIVPGISGNATEVSYNITKGGWVLITKKINPDILIGTKGISFSYKGKGMPNTLELKLCYPDSNNTSQIPDTTFIRDFHASTDTGDEWKTINVTYQEITCRWPEDKCRLYKNRLNLSSVDRIEFAVSNKQEDGDTPGSGKIVIDDVQGILESGPGPERLDPGWIAIIVAIIGLIGVIIGNWIRRRPE